MHREREGVSRREPAVQWRSRFRRLSAAAVVVVVVAVTSRASAATFTVNNPADTTDGSCSTAPGGCTLREAIEAVVATAGRDTIRFEPTVFPKTVGGPSIALTSALPVIADPAGTVVDGTGARVFIGGNVSHGLVFESAAGVPLANVTVANINVTAVGGTDIHVCGGTRPDCDADLSNVLVQHVFAGLSAGDGIRIAGRSVSRARVLDCVTWNAGGTSASAGIVITASQSLLKPRVQGSSASDSEGAGILLFAEQSIIGAVIADSVGMRSDGNGIAIVAPDIVKPKITNSVGHDNGGAGVAIIAGHGTTSAVITNVLATENGQTGISVIGHPINTATALTAVVANANPTGIQIGGGVTGAKISVAIALGNTSGILVGAAAGSATGVKIKATTAADNDLLGLLLEVSDSSVQKVHANANGIGLAFEPPADRNTVKKSSANANDAEGILIQSSTSAITIQKNVALGNVIDLADENPDCGGNTWTGNVFRTASDACIR